MNTLTLLVEEAPQLVLHVRLLLLQPLLHRPGDERDENPPFQPPCWAASQPDLLTADRAPRLCAPAGVWRGAGRTTPAASAPPPCLEWDTRAFVDEVNNSGGDSTLRQRNRREGWGRPPSLQSLRFLSSSTPCRSISSRRWLRSLVSTRRLSVDVQGSVCTCKKKRAVEANQNRRTLHTLLWALGSKCSCFSYLPLDEGESVSRCRRPSRREGLKRLGLGDGRLLIERVHFASRLLNEKTKRKH